MALGPMLRRWMPPTLERRLSGLYRAVFVDLGKVAAVLADTVPADARILDIGGGDGELLNRLFALRSDVRVTMVDIAPSVGKFIEPRYRSKVECNPGTSVEQHLGASPAPYDVALVSDVMHHLPAGYRGDFLRALHAALRPGGMILVKDIEPGHPIASLSLFCDRHVSGDHGVALVSGEDLRRLAGVSLPRHRVEEAGLLERDRPNYLFKFEFEEDA